jgi:hypothetical protein
MRIVIRSSSLLFSILGIILHIPLAKVRKSNIAIADRDGQQNHPSQLDLPDMTSPKPDN